MIVKNPQTKESLFSIGEHFYALESLILEMEGEITDEIDHWLEEYQAKEREKIDAYCYLIQKFDDIAEEAQRLADRSISYRSKVKAMKERLKCYLEHRGKKKIETPRFTVSVCQNGGKQPIRLYEDVQVEHLPDCFIRSFIEPDMPSIRQAIENKDPQAMNIAQILPRGTHLRIK